MTKIAFNNCFGGFDLSDQAFEALLNRKGIEWDCVGRSLNNTYYKKGNANEEDAFISPYGFYNNRTDRDLSAVIDEIVDRSDVCSLHLQIRVLPAALSY